MLDEEEVAEIKKAKLVEKEKTKEIMDQKAVKGFEVIHAELGEDTKTSKSKSKKSKAKKGKGKGRRNRDELDSDDSLNDFIVPDDEVEE